MFILCCQLMAILFFFFILNDYLEMNLTKANASARAGLEWVSFIYSQLGQRRGLSECVAAGTSFDLGKGSVVTDDVLRCLSGCGGERV